MVEFHQSIPPIRLRMPYPLQPWQFCVVILGGWIHRQQQSVIEYLITENKILRETHGKKRILLTDDQRRLTVKGKLLGRKLLGKIQTVFTPDTILRWHRQLVALKWDYTGRRKKQPGRPRVRQAIVDLVLRMARENPDWGYEWIQGALSNVDYAISDRTVSSILKAHGIDRHLPGSEQDPERPS